MRKKIDRCELLVGAMAAATGVLRSRSSSAQRSNARLILLGTGGGPRPRKTSSAPAQVVIIDDASYVVDCGDGVARQLVSANVPLATVRHIFVTHHHSDHNAVVVTYEPMRLGQG